MSAGPQSLLVERGFDWLEVTSTRVARRRPSRLSLDEPSLDKIRNTQGARQHRLEKNQRPHYFLDLNKAPRPHAPGRYAGFRRKPVDHKLGETQFGMRVL